MTEYVGRGVRPQPFRSKDGRRGDNAYLEDLNAQLRARMLDVYEASLETRKYLALPAYAWAGRDPRLDINQGKRPAFYSRRTITMRLIMRSKGPAFRRLYPSGTARPT